MRGRHALMAGIAAFLLALCCATGCYLFIVVHYRHAWSVLVVVALLFAAFVSPAVCYGYDNDGGAPAFVAMRNLQMSEQTFLNCRDLGYIIAGIFILLTYVAFAVAWYASDGASPPLGGAIVGFAGNTCAVFAYMGWLRVFVF